MKSKIKILLVFFAATVIAGCLETKKEVTLNPDGSGKMIYTVKQPLNPMMSMSINNGDAKESPKENAKKEVEKILADSTGVDAWENVSYKIGENGSLIFTGTAYFKSYNKVKIGGSLQTGNNTTLKTANGKMSLIWGKVQDAKDNTPKPVKMSDEEIAKKVKQGQAQLKQMSMMMGPMLANFKEESTFHFPGKIIKINNFKKLNSNSASISISGKQIAKVINEFANDKKAIAKAIKAGRNLQKDGPSDDFMNKKIFGKSGRTEVLVDLGKPQFNYKSAVANARKNYPAMCKKLGIKTVMPVVIPEVKGKVQGKMNGTPFKLDKAYIQGGILHLAQGKKFFADKEFTIFLFLNKNDKLDGRKFKISPSSRGMTPHVHIRYKIPDKKFGNVEMFTGGYTMMLEFGKVKDGAVTGKISLSVPSKNRTQISGNFAAKVKK